ncbi:MAG: deoxyribose-phosphate aldolase [Planctomycetes bacterium]|nr:deoxyribose-phosphate aldolase [Planctomycetota bacterium]
MVPGAPPVPAALAPLIDHTLLKPDAVRRELNVLCEEAERHGFASVCVEPTWVGYCARLLARSRVKVCTVIGFPFGATLSEVKAFEAERCQDLGAGEIDMVINVGALKSGDIDFVRNDIRGVVKSATYNTVVKVILETTYLSREEKIIACTLSKEVGADFVKTSTGYGPSGATVEDIALMRAVVGPEMGVKASGGVRDFAGALAMVQAGATRIGASASVKIVSGAKGGPATPGKY